MTKRKAPRAAHNKSTAIHATLPAWYRSLLMAIDPKSNSRALRLLVTHALQSGAAERFLGLPVGPADPEAVAQAILAGQTLAQAVGGYDRMRRHLATYDGDVTRAMAAARENQQHRLAQQTQSPRQNDPIPDGYDEDDRIPPGPIAPPTPTQVATAQPVAPKPAHNLASTIAETEAIMAEIQKGFSLPPP